MGYNWTTNEQITASKLNRTGIGFDCIVDAAGNGDYTTLAAALAASKKRIFIKDGNYTEAELDVNTTDVLIVGQSKAGTIITSSVTGGSGTGNKAMAINYSNFEMYNLTFNGKADFSTDNLFYVLGGYLNIRIHDCIIGNVCNKILNGNSNYNVFFLRNRVDATGAVNYATFFAANGALDADSIIEGNYFNCSTSNTTYAIYNCYGNVRNNWFQGKKFLFSGGDNYGSENFTGNYVLCGNVTVQDWNIVSGNYFDSSGYTEVDPFLTISILGVATGNNVIYNYSPGKALNLARGMFIGNVMLYGKYIEISGANCMFCNNIWSPNGGATCDLTIDGGANYCQVNENIIKYSGATPTITDSATGTVKQNNILMTS